MKSIIRFILILIILIPIASIASAEEIQWDNTKTVGSLVQITAPRSFTTCIISPDSGSGWDTCTAYVEIYNNFANYNGSNINTNSIWKKSNVRNVNYQYTKTITPSNIINPYFNDSSQLWENTTTPSRIYSGWQSTIPNVNKSQTLAVKINFEKRRWSIDAFDFSGKFGAYEQLLDPDVDACGTLNVDGATYTLNQSVTSTGTCFTVGAHNITIEGMGYTITFANTSTGKGITNTGYDNVSIYNLTIKQGNLSTITNRGIEYLSNANFGEIQNVTITVNNTSSIGLYLSSSSNNTLISNTVSSNANVGLYLTSSSNNNTLTSNTASSNTYIGLYIFSSSNNTLTSNTFNTDSITATIEDISIDNSSRSNKFINTSFTKPRKIEFNDALLSEFNQSQDGGISFVSTNLSVARTTNRSIINWNQSNITFKETFTGTNTANYSVVGLIASTDYQIWNDTNIDYNLTSDSNGVLADFTINFTTAAKTIKILYKSAPSPITCPTANETYCAYQYVNSSVASQAGTLNYSYVQEGLVQQFEEEPSGELWIDYYFNLSGAPSGHSDYEIDFYGNYTGGPAHYFDIQIYSYLTSSFRTLTNATNRIVDNSTNSWHNISVQGQMPEVEYRNATKISIIRLKHSSSVAAGHKLYVDTLRLRLYPGSNFTVHGWIFNKFQIPILNAKITMDGNTTYSDVDGEYTFNNMTHGDYIIRAQAIGFRNHTGLTFELNNNTEALNITMEERKMGEVIMPGFEGVGMIFILLITIYLFKRKSYGK